MMVVFARARRAHNGHKRALRHMQREIFDDLSVLCVAEVHVRKVYVTLSFGKPSAFGLSATSGSSSSKRNTRSAAENADCNSPMMFAISLIGR